MESIITLALSGLTMSAPQQTWIQRGRSLHLHHGPIDLIIRCEGQTLVCSHAYSLAAAAFDDVLVTLVSELRQLKKELHRESTSPLGPVARRMYQACLPFVAQRVTPMAAVAGSVADYVLQAMLNSDGLTRAWVNNGGDIACYLAEGEIFECGMIGEPLSTVPDGIITVSATDGIGGIATSGRAMRGQGGRSFSLGIADAVTVLAESAAAADVAATLIANQVDLPGHPAITRVSAIDLDPDSDLELRPVVTQVGHLSNSEVLRALERGCQVATDACRDGLIHSAVLTLDGQRNIIRRKIAPVTYDLAPNRRMFA